MTLLLEKILSFKERSPLITILDDILQSGRPLIREFCRRASQTKRNVVYVAFEAVSSPPWLATGNVKFVHALNSVEERIAVHPHASTAIRPVSAILAEIQLALSPNPQTSIVLIDCITPMLLEPSLDPVQFLGSLLSFQPYTVVLSHHFDVALPDKYPHYPSSHILLSHISTAVVRVESFFHHLRRLEAESHALPDSIEQDTSREGVVLPLGSNSYQHLIVTLEFKKKTGRSILEKSQLDLTSGVVTPFDIKQKVDGLETDLTWDFGTTFNLGITQRQRESKEDVVLPHFSAQGANFSEKSLTASDINYTLEAEDDFDDEEDVDEDLLI